MSVVDFSSETPRPRLDTSRGERIDQRTGCVISRLPATGMECPGEKDRRGRHAEECQCEGSGFLVFRRPRNVEPVDATDDGIASYEAALLLRDQGGMRTDRLGASIDELMARPVAKRTSSGSRRATKKAKGGEPQPKTARDGREELHPDTRARRGRPPTYVELGTQVPTARHVAVKMTVAPETLKALIAEGMALVELSERVITWPKDRVAAPVLSLAGRRIPCVVYTTRVKRTALHDLARSYGESIGRLHDRYAQAGNRHHAVDESVQACYVFA